MIKEVIIVEGKNDIHAVKRAVEADCIATGGFTLAPHSLEKIAQAYTKRGIIILTDPDSAGERIRNFLSQRFPEAKHAFVPKEDAIAKNDMRYLEWQPSEEFIWSDIMQYGLSGTQDASAKRAIVGAKLGIGYANAKTFLQRLNHYGVTRAEFEQAVQ
jgi:ribonuclease M5